MPSAFPNAPVNVVRCGLTGGIGSGKSTVASLWRERGVEVIDLDALARAVLDQPGPAVAEVVSHWGERLRDPESGGVQRGELARRVFGNPLERQVLERIVHSRVWQAVATRESELAGGATGDCPAFVVHDSPLLLELRHDHLYPVIAAVIAPTEARIERVMTTRGKSRQYVTSIMDNQVSDPEREARAHVLIRNEGDLVDLRAEADAALEVVRGRAGLG